VLDQVGMENAARHAAVSPAALPEAIRAQIEERITKGRLELPMLPHVANEILAGGLDEGAELGTISALLHRDQTLAGHVLRIANSPAYAGRSRIQSIQQALVRIGLSQLREIILAVTFQSGVFRVAGYEDIVRRLWAHSTVAGAYAKEVARLLRTNVESAFVCGLLHDVGKPVVLSMLQDLGRKAPPLAPEQCIAAMAEHHTRVGQYLAERWALPEPVADSIAHHHNHQTTARHALAAQTTCLADLLSHCALGTDERYTEATVRGHPVCAALNLYPEDLDALMEKRDAMLALAEALVA
jgi:putative nucleotidyltransferase with HDIG domain